MKAPKRTPSWRKLGALLLAQRLDLLGNLLARQDAQIFDKPEGDAAHGAFEPFGVVELDQWFDDLGDVAFDEFLQARLNGFALGAVQLIVGDDVDARLQSLRTGAQARDRIAMPADAAVACEDEIGIGAMRRPPWRAR